jgi:hypothetical protein
VAGNERNGSEGRRALLEAAAPWLAVAVAAAWLLSEALFGAGSQGGRALAPYDALGAFEPWSSETELEPTNALLLDQPLVTLPWLAFFEERLAAGEVPLWNPHSFLGQPIHAALTGGLLWPLNAAFLATGDWRATAWTGWLELVLAGGFCGMFVRRLGAGVWAASAAAVAYGLCGFQVVWLGHPHTNVALLLPVALLSVERLARSGERGGAWRRDVLLVALWSAGMAVAGHVQTALHAGLATAVYAGVRTCVRRGAGLGPRLGCAAWLRLVGGGVLGALLAAPQLVPFGEYLAHSRARAVDANVDVAAPIEPLDAAVMLVDPWHHGDPLAGTYDGPLGDHVNFCEIAGGYTGRVALAFALLGVVVGLRRRDARVVAALVGTLGAALVAWQVPIVRDVVNALPVLSQTKTMRFALLLALGVVVLAAYGITRVQERLPRRARPVVGSMAVVAIAVELVSFGRGFNPTIDAREVFAPTPTLEFLAERDGRATGVLGATLIGNANVPYGVSTLLGYDSIENDRVSDVIALLSTDGRGAVLAKEIRWFDRQVPLSRVLGVRWIVAREELGAPLVLAFEGPGGLKVYEDPGALPRVFVARGHAVVADEGERLARLGAADFEPLVAVVEEEPPFEVAMHATPPGTARFVSDEPRRLVIDVELEAPALVVVADAFDAGWRATSGGADVPIVHVDHALRGVWLPAGAQRVEMVYAPGSFRLGVALACVALLVLAALPFVRRRKELTA